MFALSEPITDNQFTLERELTVDMFLTKNAYKKNRYFCVIYINAMKRKNNKIEKAFFKAPALSFAVAIDWPLLWQTELVKNTNFNQVWLLIILFDNLACIIDDSDL